MSDSRRGVNIGVDDNSFGLSLLKETISSAGYTFFGASSGQEAVRLTERLIPQLIVLDVEMPGMDGFSTCRQLRSRLSLKHVPIAFLTARKTAEDVRTGLGAGGNDFIVKPFDPAKLLARIRHWVGR